MPHYSRNQRVQEEYQHEVARIISYEMDDPRLEMATVTHVEVSRDLSDAKVHVSCLSDNPEDEANLMQALESAKGFIKRLLSQRLIMRKLPEPHFRLDRSTKKAFRIFEVLEQIRDEIPPAEDSDADDSPKASEMPDLAAESHDESYDGDGAPADDQR